MLKLLTYNFVTIIEISLHLFCFQSKILLILKPVMKKIFLLFFASIFVISAQSQSVEDYNPYKNVQKDSVSTENAAENKFDLEKAKKMSFGMEFGTGIESYMRNSNAFYTYTAPSLRYAINKKLSVRVGVMMMNINTNNMLYVNSEGIQKVSGNILQTSFYAAADYYATEKLRITGEVLYGNNTMPNSLNKFNQNPKAFSIGATYKINDYMQIGIKIGERQNQQGIYVPGNGFSNDSGIMNQNGF